MSDSGSNSSKGEYCRSALNLDLAILVVSRGRVLSRCPLSCEIDREQSWEANDSIRERDIEKSSDGSIPQIYELLGNVRSIQLIKRQ